MGSSGGTVQDLRDQLAKLSLDVRGTKQTLKQRLLKHHQRERAAAQIAVRPEEERERPRGQSYDSFLVLDVEATCREIRGNPKLAFSYPNEIIEWPVILLQWTRKNRRPRVQLPQKDEHAQEWRLDVVDEFHSFVKPTWDPNLSEFCTRLTGITQDQVDSAPDFATMLKRFEREFIAKHDLFTKKNKTIWITDGPWDLRDFIAKTCYLSRIPRRPDYLAGDMIDLKLLVSQFFNDIELDKKNRRKSTSPSSCSPRSSPPPCNAAGTASQPVTTARLSVKAGNSDADDAQLCPPSSISSDDDARRSNHYESNRFLLARPPDLTIDSVLAALTLAPFIGKRHSGLSDTRNLARIVLDLSERRRDHEDDDLFGEADFVVPFGGNRRVPEGGVGARERRWNWMAKGGGVDWTPLPDYDTK